MREYAMVLSDEGRVLYLTPRKGRSRERDLERIEKTCAYFDRILPAPNAPSTGEPESDDAEGAQGEDVDEEGWTISWSWGAADWERDRDTLVLIAARNEKDYHAALEHLGERYEYLAPWLATARDLAGCTLESPLVAIWLLSGDGLEEYRPENELVHRLTKLLLLRRFGRQPAWVVQGLAWHVEEELTGSVYCFPWRSEFVYATEHTAWKRLLSNAYEERENLPFDEVVGLTRGAFQGDLARAAWGAMTFLVRYHADALPRMLEELRELWREKGRILQEDGTWELIPGWEPPAALQLPIFLRATGADGLFRLLAFFQEGERYEPDEG